MTELAVLMPARNASKYILRSVRTTLLALPRSAELVVLDDASDDDTASLISTVSDPRLRFIRSESNLGVSQGLNMLLANSDSRFVARMDADDVCIESRFAHQIARMRHVDVTFCSAVGIDELGRRRRNQVGRAITAECLPLHLLLGNFLLHPGMLARRAVLDGGYANTSAEDYELWLRLVADGVILERTAHRGIMYRRHSAQISKAHAWRESIRLEAEEDGPLYRSYRAAYRRVLGSDPSVEAFSFAMNLYTRRGDLRALWGASRGLGFRERWGLAQRLTTTSLRAMTR